MPKIESSFIKYNANTRNNDVGDCVKRSLSVAYSMDYDAVSRELNKIKRDIGASAYNYTRVYSKFVQARGDKFVVVYPRVTVDDFCNEHPTGVYLLETGKTATGYTTHLCAVVSGDLYDSWHSEFWYVDKFCKVSGGSEVSYSDEVSAEEVSEELDPYFVECTDKLNNKSKIDCEISCSTPVVMDQYTYRQYVIITLREKAPRYSKYYGEDRIANKIICKLNPRLSKEENVSSLKKKIYQKIYDWVYNVTKEIQDSIEMENSDNFHPSIYSRDSKRFILQLPEWARSRINYVYKNSYNEYELEMDPLEGDPRNEGYLKGRSVLFRADTLRELKQDLELYKDRYLRVDYDY